MKSHEKLNTHVALNFKDKISFYKLTKVLDIYLATYWTKRIPIFKYIPIKTHFGHQDMYYFYMFLERYNIFHVLLEWRKQTEMFIAFLNTK